jgi:hypothetical protein
VKKLSRIVFVVLFGTCGFSNTPISALDLARFFPDAELVRGRNAGHPVSRRVKKLSRALITAKTVFFDEGDQECQPNA